MGLVEDESVLKRFHFFGTYTIEVAHGANAANQDDAERLILDTLFSDYGMGRLEVYSVDEEEL